MEIEGRRTIPLGTQQITNLSASTGLTLPSSPPVPVRAALITCETVNVRYREDGVAPTSTVGMLMKVGDPPRLFEGSLAALHFIQVSAGASLDVTYYG